MAITCCIDSAAGLLRSRAQDTVSYADAVHHLQRKEERHVLEYAELFDARGAKFDLSLPEIHQIVKEVRRVTAGTVPGAIAVVTNCNFIRGLARAYAALTIQDNPAFEIFDSPEEAQRWLEPFSARTGVAAVTHK
jgi:hypothetical protein